MNELDNNALQGKTVLLTGAAGGIGDELLKAFLAAGAGSVIAATRSGSGLAHADGRVEQIALDLTSESSVATAAHQVGGRVDIIVNNAGMNANRRLDLVSLLDAQTEMDVNYFGLLRMYRAFSPYLKEKRSGAFVNMLTVLAHMNHPLMASYCASKAAALSLTQAMRAEMARYGVRVYAVMPAAVDTKMSANIPPPKLAPSQLALDVVAALAEDTEDVYPGAAAGVRDLLQEDWKAVEKRYASRLP